MSQTQLPANFAGLLSLSAGQQMNLGTLASPLDGRSAFTLSGWFQVPETTDAVTVLQQGDLFSFSFAGQTPRVTLGGSTLSLQTALPAGQFHQLCAVYSPPANGSAGTLQFFVDGAAGGTATFSTAPSGSSSSPALIVGNTQYPVAVRRIWLTSSVLTPDQVVETRFGTTNTAPFPVQSTWDWGQVPAAIIGALAPVPIDGAAPSLTTPGLSTSGSAVASATLPPSTSFPGVSLQGWFWFPSALPSGQANQAQSLILVGPSPSTFGLKVTPSSSGTWQLMASMGSGAFGKNGLVLSGWHNIAATWVAGGTGTLYLDGKQILGGGSGALPGLAPSTVSIGNAQPSLQAFCGSIQNVAVWNVALTGEQIQAQMMPWFPTTDVDPVAFYDFTQSPPLDIVSGEPLSLLNGASVQALLWSASNAAPSPQMLVAKPLRKQSLKGLRPRHPMKTEASLWTPEKEQELLQQLQGYLSKAAADPRVKEVGPALVAQLKERFARGREGNPDLTGIVHTERQGEEWITFYYGVNGPEAILRRSTTSFKTDTCMNWVIDFVATALFGLLDIMGIPLSTGVATKALQKLLGKAKIWEAVGEVLESTLTADSIVALLKAIYDGGGMSAFVKAVLDDVSWYDFLWMVAQVTLELVGLLVPGLEEALVLAKCTLLVVQLGVLMDPHHRPANCPTRVG